jgi:hypothetical protein
MLATWIELSTSLGLAAAFVWSIRWYWYRHRWRRFEEAIRKWARDEHFFPEDLSSGEWKSLVAIKLSESWFSPTEIRELLDLAIIVAKGRTALEIRGRI